MDALRTSCWPDVGDVVAIPLFKLPDVVRDRPDDHSVAVRVGTYRERAICATCATVLVPRFDTFSSTGPDGIEHVIHGGYVGGPDDAVGHLLPFNKEDLPQDDTDEQSATDPTPSKRPDGIPAGAPKRSKDTPSRSPEARHKEYVRAKRREAHAARA